ncbi:MAG TPA: amino acid transport protein [Thermoanaerobaculia bacterium]
MNLWLGLLFGAVGSGYLIYGKRQQDGIFLVFGFLLILFPYFVSHAFLAFGLGIILTLAPLAHHRGWF